MKNTTNKQRFYLVIVSILFLVWFSSKFAFSRTLELHTQIDELNQKIETSKDAPVRLNQMQARLLELEKHIGMVSNNHTGPLIVEIIDSLCQQHNLLIKEIPEKHIFTNDALQVFTYQVSIEGKFNGLVNLLNELERDNKGGKLRACVFATNQDFATGQRYLTGTYYLQSVNKTN